MDSFVDERDYKLLENDKYTFFVLKNVMGDECHVLLTDHERLIICHSEHPFPVWVWTPDDATGEELAKAVELINEVLPVSDGYTYNMKYELAERFMKKASENGNQMYIKTNMFAYDCPEPKEPEEKARGEFHKCTMDDVETLVELYDLFYKEIDVDIQTLDDYRAKAEDGIPKGLYYLWKNPEGRYVASCNYRPNGDMAVVGMVYTRVDERRKHYAENLVYGVTKTVKDMGCVPMLYTDADYAASNACYEKIGYIPRGKLCMIA